ncbi:MAG: DNA-3-methyladenine glycosylase [Thermoproteota archaeon]|nr:DNA-3-methyladenine glycosylase [Thermoproteota archaeon]
MSVDPINYLCQTDFRLGNIIRSIGKYSIKTTNDPFQSLIQSIIFQQLAGRAASVIYGRFLDYYSNISPGPEQILSTPDHILKDNVGLSSKKIEYLKDLSTRIIDRRLNLVLISEMTDEEIVSQLMQVKGIGRWTAEMFLIFCLGRKDIFPVGDLGVRKAIQRLYSLPELPSPSTMLDIAQSWKPYRSIATWYLWKSLSKFDSIG